MVQRIVIDPITRIEGHLRIEAEIDEDKTITSAYSSGTMIRGLEIILRGRDPREAWAFAQRTCGVCTTVHAIASIRSVENALGIEIPRAANLIRNLIIAQQTIHDHVMHFYHLHALDWVDVVNCLAADAEETANLQKKLSPWRNASATYFESIRLKVKAIVDSGQLSIFSQGYWGHPAYRLPPAVNLLAVAHFLEALDWQRDVVKIHTLFGGKNPHPNFVVGGVPLPIDLQSEAAVNARTLSIIQESMDRMEEFVTQVYIPDLMALVPFYKEYAKIGEGVGNFLTVGEFPEEPGFANIKHTIPSLLITNRDLNNPQAVTAKDLGSIQEYISHSWYDYNGGDTSGLHPWNGETNLHYTSPKSPYQYLETDRKYSWLKAPRWNEKVVEVGPLARVSALLATGDELTKNLVSKYLENFAGNREALFSTLGRTAARGIETAVVVVEMKKNFRRLVELIKKGDTETFNDTKWEPGTWPQHAEGVGLMEAPRGALSHWIVIDQGKISNYQLVVPTTWNGSPRDHRDQPSPYEASLVGTRLVDAEKPLELLRTIHSFDPCMACAIHLIDQNIGGKSHKEA